MKSIYHLKFIIVCFFILQSLFSVFYESISGQQNIFPIYTWRIFHPRPDKYLTDYIISIHEIDDEVFDPPVIDLNFVRRKFPHIMTYTLTRKIGSLDENNPLRKKIIENINSMLLKEKSYVRWGVVERRYNPIELFWEGKVIHQKAIEIFDAKR